MKSQQSPQARLRAALAEDRAPDRADIAAVLDELDRTRAESDSRWQAIGQLAPAAKRLRASSQAQTRVLDALRQHLDRLDAILDSRAADDALTTWARDARALLAKASDPTSATGRTE